MRPLSPRSIIKLVESAAVSLDDSLEHYWPAAGRSEIAERNQTMHLASELLHGGWRCWQEGHAGSATNQRFDLLAWHSRSRTLLSVEAKRLYSAGQAASMAEDVRRITAFTPIGGRDTIPFKRRFGLLLGSTWGKRAKNWWMSKTAHGEEEWRTAASHWDVADPRIHAATSGYWGTCKLRTCDDGGEPGRHHLLYAIWDCT